MAITQKKPLVDVIEQNNWRSTDFLQSTAVNALFQSNLIDTSPTGQAIINGINVESNNIPSTLDIGYAGYPFQEPQIAIPANTDIPEPIDAEYLTVKAKTFYNFQWWRVYTIQKDLMSVVNAELYLREYLGNYLSTHFNYIISNTLGGLSTVSEIVVGGADVEFSEALFDEAQQIRGDRVDDGMSKIFMSSKTLYDIKKKQDTLANKNPLISQYQMTDQNQIEIKGSAQGTSLGQFLKTRIGMPTRWAYKSSIPIVLDDVLEDGLIAIVDPKAFAFLQKNFVSPIRYVHNPDQGGVGNEKFGLVFLALMHPVGFNFIGTKATGAGAGQYANITGLSYAELKTGGQYELAFEARQSRIRLMKVKIGS